MTSISTALVTGGCGFVGRHFVRRLLSMGVKTTVVDNLSAGIAMESWPDHLRPDGEQSDLLDVHYVDIRDFMKSASADFDLILHCAAVVGGRLVIDGEPLSVATDLAIDADLFNWVATARPAPRKLVYFSSSAAYPTNLQTAENSQLLVETMIDLDGQLGVPDMTYGWAKLTGEMLARHAARAYGIDVVCYRPFSGYGEDQDFTYPFPSVVRRAARRDNPIVVWGSGTQTRDFIYIEDVVDAVFTTMNAIAPGDALNLGSGIAVSFRQLAELACKVVGHEAIVTNDATKPEGVYARVADCTKLNQFYRPTTSLESGLRIVYQYQLDAGLIRDLGQ